MVSTYLKWLEPLNPDPGTSVGLVVPEGFAITPVALQEFFARNDLERRIAEVMNGLSINSNTPLAAAGAGIRRWIKNSPFPEPIVVQIHDAYHRFGVGSRGEVAVSVRASTTDGTEAILRGSAGIPLFACGAETVVNTVKQACANLFEDRAVASRLWDQSGPIPTAITVTVQRIIRNDRGISGLMFNPGAGAGLRDMVFVSSTYGLGEAITHGLVNADEFLIHKPTLAAGRPAIFRRNRGEKTRRIRYGGQVFGGAEDDGPCLITEPVPEADQLRFSLEDTELEALAREFLVLKQYAGEPIEVQWGKDGYDGRFYLLDVRPRTVDAPSRGQILERYHLNHRGRVLARGRSVGQRIGTGPVRVIRDLSEIGRFRPGDVMVTNTTAPDWEHFMHHAAAVVTERGGRTCHTCIVAREIGIPAVVGCRNATEILPDGEEVTVSCAEGDIAYVYAGQLDYGVHRFDLGTLPDLPVKIQINTGSPDRAFDYESLPSAGIGLARLEFIISRIIAIHPKALLEFERQPEDIKARINQRAAGYPSPVRFYVDKLAEGIATLAVAFAPRRVIVRLSDFKSNEYANMLGGALYEPQEMNPMLGFRGTARYLSEDFLPCFELECYALQKVRDEMGLCNVDIVVPFVRTVNEGRQVVELLARNGLTRGRAGLRVMMTCELPANALLAEQFLEHFDGFSIGSNDLTQLTLGVDRDSGAVAAVFDEQNPAVKVLLHRAIQACRRAGKYVGVCGHGAADRSDFIRWLMEEGVDSVCIDPDSVVETWLKLAGHLTKNDTPVD